MPNEHKLNHFHNYIEEIIYQSKLSNILFYEPGTLNYSEVICRTVWNKINRKDILMKNYTNLNIPGYMYNIRKVSISHSNLGIENDTIICHNFFIYFKLS